MSQNHPDRLPGPYQSWQEQEPPKSPKDTLNGMEMIRQGVHEGIISTHDQLHVALGTLSPFLHSVSHDPSYMHVPNVYDRIEMNGRLVELYHAIHAREQLTQPLSIEKMALLQRKSGIAEAKRMLKAVQQREKKGLPAHAQRAQLDGFLRNRGLTHADLVQTPKAQEATA